MEFTKEQQEQLQLISSCTTIDEAVVKLCAADSSLTSDKAKAVLAELGIEELKDEGLRLVSGGLVSIPMSEAHWMVGNGTPSDERCAFQPNVKVEGKVGSLSRVAPEPLDTLTILADDSNKKASV